MLYGESHTTYGTRLGSLLVSGIPALRLFGDQLYIVPILRLFIDAALLTMALQAMHSHALRAD